MDLYVAAGARYFVAQAAHHDNFHNWNSRHHPWNAVQVGPRKDIVGLWRDAARAAGSAFRAFRAHGRLVLLVGAEQGCRSLRPLGRRPLRRQRSRSLRTSTCPIGAPKAGGRSGTPATPGGTSTGSPTSKISSTSTSPICCIPTAPCRSTRLACMPSPTCITPAPRGTAASTKRCTRKRTARSRCTRWACWTSSAANC